MVVEHISCLAGTIWMWSLRSGRSWRVCRKKRRVPPTDFRFFFAVSTTSLRNAVGSRFLQAFSQRICKMSLFSNLQFRRICTGCTLCTICRICTVRLHVQHAIYVLCVQNVMYFDPLETTKCRFSSQSKLKADRPNFVGPKTGSIGPKIRQTHKASVWILLVFV